MQERLAGCSVEILAGLDEGEIEVAKGRVDGEHHQGQVAVDEAEKKKAKAKRKRAEAKTEEAKAVENTVKTAPKKKVGPPKQEDIPIMAIQARFIAEAAGSVRVARENINRIKDSLPDLTPKGIAALTEAALEAANAWTEAARIVRSELIDESSHLSVLEKYAK